MLLALGSASEIDFTAGVASSAEGPARVTDCVLKDTFFLFGGAAGCC